jgi:hypothetical protein
MPSCRLFEAAKRNDICSSVACRLEDAEEDEEEKSDSSILSRQQQQSRRGRVSGETLDSDHNARDACPCRALAASSGTPLHLPLSLTSPEPFSRDDR